MDSLYSVSKSKIFKQLRKLTYIQSLVRQMITAIRGETEIGDVEILHGIDIQELDLGERITANLRREKIISVLDLLNFGKERLLNNIEICQTGLDRITVQLEKLGLTWLDQ